MKRLLCASVLVMASVSISFGASDTYVNNGPFNSPPSLPPQIDATNFVNNGLFNIFLNNVSGSVASLNTINFHTSIAPFSFSDVLFYTNRGSLICDTGFTFDTAPASNGVRHAAAIFGNSNLGLVSAGSVTNSVTSNLVLFVNAGGLPQINVSATNVYNTGVLNVGVTGVIKVDGNRLDLSRGTLHVEGFDDFAANNFFSGGITNILAGNFNSPSFVGIFPTLHGIGLQTNVLNLNKVTLPISPNPFIITPASTVTYNNGLTVTNGFQFIVNGAAAYAYTNQINQSNFSYQVVFVNTNLPGISTDVRFDGGGNITLPVIQWEAIVTNNYNSGSIITTNFLYLSDAFGAVPTNTIVTVSTSLSGLPVFAPYNYSFYRSYFGYTNLPGPNSVPYQPQVIFANGFGETNAYSAFEVNVEPVTVQPDITAVASPLTNLPGRIQITATNWLDLTKAKITGPNYINIQATNHFAGTSNALIIAPNMDINVATTNGFLAINNLVAPNVPRFNGLVDMYSARWTNVTAAGVTNTYNVLMVNASLISTSAVSVLNFTAKSTNVILNDSLNISSNLLINAQNLTLATNAPTSSTPYGAITILNPNIIWSTSFPTLQNLTNFGEITVPSTTFFLGTRQSPYYPSNFTQPYLSFVNHGAIFTGGDFIYANYLENNGNGITNVYQFSGLTITNTNSALLYSSTGPISLQASNAYLTAGSIIAAAGDETITAGSLLVSNQLLQASGALTFSVTNLLVDGGVAASNFWSAGDGLNLLVKPVTGDFLGTTITLTSPAELEVEDVWAGLDKGQSTSGFLNNGAIGHLILDGGDNNSQFYFGGLDATNKYALYVDLLDLRDGATNRVNQNGVETFSTFDLAPNFTIYYADAMAGGLDIAEKLNGANNGQLVWLPAYAGTFSSTNLVFPAGVTNVYNRALAASTDIDSDGDGIPNAFDPTPFFTAANVNLTLSMTNLPPKTPLISWYALANSTNILYYLTNFSSTNKIVVTNFVQGVNSGMVSVVDRGRTNAMGFYQVKENPAQP